MGFELGFGKKKEPKKLTKEEELRLEARKKETVEELRKKHISELTDEQIIEIGLKTHTKTDKMCFLLIGVMALMIFIPPIFRKVFYDPDLAISERETVYMNLRCIKRRSKITYSLKETIDFNYRDGEILNANIVFKYENIKTSKKIEPPQEVTKYIDMNISKIEKKEAEDNLGYSFFIDFEKNSELLNEKELNELAFAAPTQITNMGSLAYSCTPTTKYTIRVFRGEKLIDEYDKVEEE